MNYKNNIYKSDLRVRRWPAPSAHGQVATYLISYKFYLQKVIKVYENYNRGEAEYNDYKDRKSERCAWSHGTVTEQFIAKVTATL